MDELPVVVNLGNRSLDTTDESEQQISKHDHVEDKRHEEDEPLSVSEATNLESSQSTNEDLLPNLDILSEPSVFPGLEVMDFGGFVKGWFNWLFRARSRDVQDLSNGEETIGEGEHSEHHEEQESPHLHETFLDHSDGQAEGLDTSEHQTKSEPEEEGCPSNKLPVKEPVWLVQISVVEVNDAL